MTHMYCHECNQIINSDSAIRTETAPAEWYAGGHVQDASHDDPRCPMCGEYLSDEVFTCAECGDHFPLTEAWNYGEDKMCKPCWSAMPRNKSEMTVIIDGILKIKGGSK